MDGKYRSEKNVKKFTKKTKGLLENELERLIEEGLLPKEAKAEVSEKKIMAYIYIQQPYTTSEITLLASLDVSDAFDAMTANRVYRQQLDIGYVLNEFEKFKGKPSKFDEFRRVGIPEIFNQAEFDFRWQAQ